MGDWALTQVAQIVESPCERSQIHLYMVLGNQLWWPSLSQVQGGRAAEEGNSTYAFRCGITEKEVIKNHHQVA